LIDIYLYLKINFGRSKGLCVARNVFNDLLHVVEILEDVIRENHVEFLFDSHQEGYLVQAVELQVLLQALGPLKGQ